MSGTDAEIRQIKRRRATILKMVRQGHESQFQRLDDFGVWAAMQDLGMQMGRNAVITMLQDLCTLEYLRYRQGFSDENNRVTLSEIELTPRGLTVTIRRQSNDDLLFD
jgi:hypothetical protein